MAREAAVGIEENGVVTYIVYRANRVRFAYIAKAFGLQAASVKKRMSLSITYTRSLNEYIDNADKYPMSGIPVYLFKDGAWFRCYPHGGYIKYMKMTIGNTKELLRSMGFSRVYPVTDLREDDYLYCSHPTALHPLLYRVKEAKNDADMMDVDSIGIQSIMKEVVVNKDWFYCTYTDVDEPPEHADEYFYKVVFSREGYLMTHDRTGRDLVYHVYRRG